VNTFEDWYKISIKQVLNFTRGHSVMEYYGYCLMDALREVYPEVTWNPLLSHHLPRKSWKSKDNQRNYLDWIAEQLNLNHLYEWNRVKRATLQSFLHTNTLLNQYNNSLQVALNVLYPGIISFNSLSSI
jgi:hypothetical protein